MSEQQNAKLLGQLKEALVAIRKLKGELQKERASKSEPIAVIGTGIRFPGNVNNLDEYWKLLESGTDAIRDIPKDRFDAEALYDADPSTPGKLIVKQGGFIENIDKFDVSFYDISPIELESVDPQQRFLLEVTHEAFENAGIDVLSLKDTNTGVFIGVANNDYQTKHLRSGDYKLANAYSFSGSTISANAGRISYLMGFQGPSVTIDTACSSSLVSTHLAVQSLRDKSCDIAVAGGVNIILEPELYICFSTLSALSPDSRCKTFDNAANGFVRAEGVGVFVLKRLSDAQRDGDNILAVIKGTAVNQDGRSNGFTAPNVAAQEKLIRAALQNAGLTPQEIGYIEAHGTGTKIGDPIEIEAISKVFKTAKSKDNPLLVGSVKSNIGHLEASAGIAGMIKAILCLQNNKVPKNVHFNTPNELIPWSSIPVKVVNEMTPFNGAVGISSFGLTGTNGHVIIDRVPEYEQTQNEANASDIFVLPMSAKSPEALYANAKTYADFIDNSNDKLEDICAAAALQRAHFEYRHTFVARDKADLVQQLNDFAASQTPVQFQFEKGDYVKVAFVFPGFGSQWSGMGQALMEREPVFKAELEKCNAALKQFVDWDLFEQLGASMEKSEIFQPSIFAIEVALAAWWKSKGIEPDMVIGHSMGEVAAAVIGGHLSLEDGARVICTRSKVMMQRSGLGVMGVTELTEAEARQAIQGNDKLSLAVVNSPNSTVISGDADALKVIFDKLEAEGKFCRLVKGDVASHSYQMDAILDELRSGTQSVQPKDGDVEFYSTALGQQINGSTLNADYWVKNLRNTVQFAKTIQAVAENDNVVFIEVGPHSVLLNSVIENIAAAQSENAHSTAASIYRKKDECKDLLSNLGEVYNSGYDVDWNSIYNKPNQHIGLPNYQWQRERFWFDEQPDFKNKLTKSVSSADVTQNFYRYKWETASLAQGADSQRVLFIQDDSELHNTIGNQLNCEYEITSVEDAALALSASKFDKVVFLNSVTSTLDNSINVSLGLQKVVQAILSAESNPQLVVLTENAFAGEAEAISTSGVLLTGITRTLRNEHPELNATSINVEDANTNAATIAATITSDAQNIKEINIANNETTYPVLEQGISKLPSKQFDFGANASFLVTGGTSGLGLSLAEWLAKQGVGNIALVSRSGEKPETKDAVERMQAAGAQVKIFSADISDAASVDQLVQSIDSDLAKVTGVIHAAGVLADGTFTNLDKAQFEKVCQPKIAGALNLHKALHQHALTHFVTFSSGAAVLGSIGQSNYNGANLFLDQFMLWRAQNNLPATSINWGNIGGVGMAAAQENRGDRLSAVGMDSIQPSEFDAYFNAIFSSQQNQLIPIKIDFDKWAAAHPALQNDATFAEVISGIEVASSSDNNKWGNSLAAANKRIKDMLKNHLAAVTKIPSARIKEEETFKSMGVDSMMALQFKNKIQTDTGLNLAVSSIWTHATIQKYVAFLVKELNLESELTGGSNVSASLSIKQIKDKLRNHIAAITKLQAVRLKENETFKSMGIDSMQALQLKNKLQADLGLNLAVSSVWTHPTIEKYAAFLEQQLGGNKVEETPAVEEVKSEEEISKEVDDMSLDDLMDQLDQY